MNLIILLLLMLAVVLVFRTIFVSSTKSKANPVSVPQISDAAIETLSDAIRIQTISHNDPNFDNTSEFIRFQEFLAERFPEVHDRLDIQRFDEYGILYLWKGRNPGLKPVMLTAHYDVVPADTPGWDMDPFSGTIKDNAIWGRGTLDYKVGVIGMLEATQQLLKEGFEPERTIILAFGGDEEVNGPKGAMKMAAWLKNKGIHLEYILDEGAVIARDMMPEVNVPIALIGIAEKGHINVELSACLSCGHASMPPDHTAVGLISRAITRLESKQFQSRLTPPVRLFLKHLASHVSPGKRLFLSNLWLFSFPVKQRFLRKPASASMVRTTMAVTMISGSDKENTLPDKATAIINIRILPGENIEGTLHRLNKIINDKDVKIRLQDSWININPIQASSTKAPGYIQIAETISRYFPETVTTPYLVTASTDSKHYTGVTDNIYRFLPLTLTPSDLEGIHGINEHIRIADFKRCIQFYAALIKKSGGRDA
ncbi:MAG: M20/M25/M40 family metallo-hydrolase [Thermodesulfobacteriota bacterium]|nr:M20/M25/M40 family metallo-hydrolase [Thermodesulfobacteriota bacterium]